VWPAAATLHLLRVHAVSPMDPYRRRRLVWKNVVVDRVGEVGARGC
jgi:hypothetical protein